MTLRLLYLLIQIFCGMLVAHISYAQAFKDFESFSSFIKGYSMQQIPHEPDETLNIEIVKMNPNTPLPSCPVAYELSFSKNGLSSASNVVALTCKDEQPWTFYVPLQVQLFTKVLAAAKMIKTGEVIEKEDVVEKPYDKYQLYDNYFTDPDEIIGQVASHSIPAGGIFGKKSIKKMPLIQKMQSVELTLKHGPIMITMRGIAKSKGFLNDQIKVLNPISHKEIEAKVTGHGTAEIEY